MDHVQARTGLEIDLVPGWQRQGDVKQYAGMPGRLRPDRRLTKPLSIRPVAWGVWGVFARTHQPDSDLEEIPNYLKDKLLRPSGGFTREEIELLGYSWPPQKGWKKDCMRRLRLEAQYREEKKRRAAVRKAAKKKAKRTKAINANRRVQAKVLEKPFVPYRRPAQRSQSREAAKAFYASWEWKKVRFEVLKKYGPKCMLCGSEERIVVDHIKPRSRYPALELDVDNLQVLCNDCNMGKSNDDETDFRPKKGLSHAESEELALVAEAEERIH